MAEVTPERLAQIIERYAWAAAATMFAIPVPGADMAATFAVWGLMIREIARAHGEELSARDGARLASQLFKNAVQTGFVWLGSATVAAEVLKLLPFAGTLAAYALDAGLAAAGTRRITAVVGAAAAEYFASGKSSAPRTFREHLEVVGKDPSFWRSAAAVLRPKRRG
jgi:uncharacterized protein (DUF697 family)